MKPNILYIHSHDTGRYIQPYGHNIPTPHMQKLAEEGVLFRKAFCAAPTCSPSRAALLTGQSAHSSGMLGLAHRGFSLNDYDQHLANYLKKQGYETALAGIQHVAKKAEIIGYDHILCPVKKDFSAYYQLPFVKNFLEDKQTSQDKPFFLSVGFEETHRVFRQPTWLEDERYCLPPAPLPDTPQTRRDMAEFKASARVFDDAVGEVLAMLTTYGLAENTLIILTTDHGIAFPNMKCNLTDHGIGVMLIMRGPDGFSGGKVVDGMVSHIDIFPTICELLHSEPPSWLQGASLMPLINEQQPEIHDAIFAEVTYHAAYEPQRAIRTLRYKYILRYDDRSAPVLPNCDDSYSKDVLLSAGWGEHDISQEQLFDLMLDPNEAHNLAGDPSMQPVLAEMRDRLHQWMVQTNDPILQGLPVSAPKGAILNPPDQASPNEPTYTVER
jgi:N-sulfoglucosamine sulfohydrolase